MMKDYLNLASASDLSNHTQRIIYRCFEILPGFISWDLLLLIFILSWLAPRIAAFFVIFFACFWLIKVFYLSLHQISGYRLMKKNLSIDWLAKVKKLNHWQDIYHLVILPFYREDMAVIRSSLQSLVEVNYPKEQIIVILTGEERGGETTRAVLRKVEKEFANQFFKFITTVHPQNLPGEFPGKGSNVAWAVKKAEELIEQIGLSDEKVIVSNFDIDTKPFPQYFAILTWHYLTNKQPLKSSYQPIPVYANNIWQVSFFSRLVAVSGTFWQIIQQERPEQLVSYSSHAQPLKVLKEVGYPHNLVSDDSRIFWKSYFFYNGDYRVIPLYYPVSMDAVMAKTFFRTLINQYKQQRRWSWGCENIPYVLYGFLQNKKIPWREKVRQSLIILDGFCSWAVTALIIFFFGWLPLILGGISFQASLLSYNLPRLTSLLMTLAMFGILVSALLNFFLLPPRPKKISRWKSVAVVLEWLLLPVILIVFGSFPALESQTRLALNKRLDFWVTEKLRKE
ncbi:MAG: glycosyltransferase family 2 protein [Minisyncoccales bacterium]